MTSPPDAAALERIVRRLFLGGDASVALSGGTRLLEEGICDSLGLVRLALELERCVPGLKVRDQDITPEHFGSIADILRFVASAGPRA